MKTVLTTGLVVGALSLAGVASAQNLPAHSKGFNGVRRGNAPPSVPSAAVPEFDPSAMGAALALLLGGTAILMGARRTNE